MDVGTVNLTAVELDFARDMPEDKLNPIVDEMMLHADQVFDLSAQGRPVQDKRSHEVEAERAAEHEEHQSRFEQGVLALETGHEIAHGSLYPTEALVETLHREEDLVRVEQADLGVAAVGLLLTAASVPELKVKYTELSAKYNELVAAGKQEEAQAVKQEQRQIIKAFAARAIGSSIKGAKQGLGYAATHAHATAHVMHGLKIASMTVGAAFGILAAVVTISDLKSAYGLRKEIIAKLEIYQKAFNATTDPAAKQVLLLKTAHLLERQTGNRARIGRGATFLTAIAIGGLKAAGVAAAVTGPIGLTLAGVAALGYLGYQGVRNREVLANKLEKAGCTLSNKVCELKLASATKKESKAKLAGKRAQAVVDDRTHRIEVAGKVYAQRLNELEEKLSHTGGFWERRSLQKEIKRTEEQLDWFKSYNQDRVKEADRCHTKAEMTQKKALSKIKVSAAQTQHYQKRLAELELEGIDAKQARGLNGINGVQLREMKEKLSDTLLSSPESVEAIKLVLGNTKADVANFDEAPIETIFAFVLSDD